MIDRDLPVQRRSSLAAGFLSQRFKSLTLKTVDRTNDDIWGPFGLTLLHEPSEPLIDFVFVHGLCGGSRKTWSKTSSIAHYWPKEWLPTEPRFKNVRIHAFGYNTNWRERGKSILTIHDFGQSLLADIQTSPTFGDKDTPIVLVGHSMGGLVIKKVLLLAKHDPSYSKIAARINSLFFLATPHRGADLATFLRNVLRLDMGHGSKTYLESLGPYSEAIQTINDEFRHVYQGVQLWSFFETKPTLLGLIVDKRSAVLELPGEHINHLNADHSQVCKFEDPSDSNYCRLRDAFVSTISSIERTRLSSRTQERGNQMKTLSLYLGIVENPATEYANMVERRVEGSCSWLTNTPTFHQWLEGLHHSPKYYWLSGEPASGKSTLAGHVIQYLEECNRDCSYFFFKDKKTGTSSVAELLCSLVWQMASTNTMIREKLLSMCNTGVPIDKNDERFIWRTVFAARILRTELRRPQYWVIDALDECANYDVLFPLLAKIEEQFPLRIFLTSRPSLVVERLFSCEDIPKVTNAITLEVSLADIKLFLEKYASYFLADSGEERQELVRTILDKSNGNFLWTSLVVKKIVNAVSKEQVHFILNSVPKEINDLYSHIFRTVMATPENARIAKAILRWSLCALRPLRIEELKEALRLDIGETLHQLEKTVASICGSLVYVDTESRVQAAHQTVLEFVFRKGDDGEFVMVKAKEHARIMEVCLEYLSSEEMKPPRFRRASSSNFHKVKRSAFAAYASVYFSDHIARASSLNDAQLTTLNDFLMSNSLTWIEAIAMTQDLTPLTQTAKNIKVYLERRAKYESPLGLKVQNVTAWASDLIHLVAQFGKPLIDSPQAIFHLIPAVCPRRSIIFRTFKSNPRGLQVTGLSQDQWDARLCCIVVPGTQTLSIACRDNKFALGLSNGTIHIYHETTFQEETQLNHGEPVRRLCFTTINNYLASAGRRKINFWNASATQLLWSAPMRDEIIAMDFSEDDRILYAATKANYAVLWDVDTGQERRRFNFCDWDEEERSQHHYRRPPIHADFSVGLGLLGVAYRQRPVSFWDLEEHEFQGQFHRSHTMYPEPFIHDFLFNPNPEINLAAVTYQDGVTTVFDPEIQRAQAIADTDASILAASPDGTVLATGSGNGIINLYDFETMKLLDQIFLHQQAIRNIVFNSSGTRFFDIRGNYCNVWEPSVLVRRTDYGDSSSIDLSEKFPEPLEFSITTTHDDDSAIISVAAHHGSELVFCGRENGSVAAYSIKTGKAAQEMFCDNRNVAIDFLVWNQSENLLASADRSGRFVVRRVIQDSTRRLQISSPILDRSPSCALCQILLSPDGKRFLVSTAESDILWNLSTASVVGERPVTEPRAYWRWVSHPELKKLFLFVGTHVETYDWATFALMSKQDSIDSGTNKALVANVVFPAQSRNLCLVLSKAPGSGSSPSIRFWPSKVFTRDNQHLPAAVCHHHIAKELKVVIGLYKSWLVFLKHSGWVCSININAAMTENFYLKHFFVPIPWHSTIGSTSVTITPRGSIIMAIKHEIAVFENGLDFEEKLPIEG